MRSFTSILLALPVALALPTVVKRDDASVPGSWIVQLEDNTVLSSVLRTARTLTGIQPTSSFNIGSFSGFTFEGNDTAVSLLSTLGVLKRIEPNYVYQAATPVDQRQSRAFVTQLPSTWGLSRISSRARGASGYIYNDSARFVGTSVYVLDTGIYSDHNEFRGRVIPGPSYISGETIADGNGHGTHVAGVAAGTIYGVSKNSTIVAVKVLSDNGAGSSSAILSGLNWATNDATNRGNAGRSVISFSLGGSRSQILNDGVAAATRAGIFVAVAAGNSNSDAGNFSPGSEPSACTVAGSDINDNRASSSNYGSVIDIFAPSRDVTSAWIGSNTATRTISGTSVAAPHIAGLAAYLIALEGVRSPAALCQRIQELSTKNVIVNPGAGSPNYLAYNGNGR